MKLFFGEFTPDYSKYHFPYQVWLKREEGDSVDEIYNNGFLPIRSLPEVYYLCRSVRVNLDKFELSSENRRILKKTEEISSKTMSLNEFSYTPQIQKFCKDYTVGKLGKDVLPASAIRAIFTSGVYNSLVEFKQTVEQKTIGLAVLYTSSSLVHFAHSFYDIEYPNKDIGARMMLEAILWAKNNGKRFAYLGTCYQESVLYKTQYSGVEFFNGFRWSENLEELKELIGRRKDDYLFQDKNFLEKNYSEKVEGFLGKYGVRVNF